MTGVCARGGPGLGLGGEPRDRGSALARGGVSVGRNGDTSHEMTRNYDSVRATCRPLSTPSHGARRAQEGRQKQ